MMATKAQKRRALPEIEKRKGPKRGSHADTSEQFTRTTGYSPEEKPKEYRAFRSQQLGEDDQPSSQGPRGGARVAPARRAGARVTKGAGKLNRRVAGFLRLGTANPRKVLMLELLAVLTIVTVDQLAHKEVPSPRVYAAPFIVYVVLTFMAELGGDGGARIAVGLGALILVALTLANAPGIVTAIQVATGQEAPAPEGVG